MSCPKADGSSPRTLTFSSPPPQCMVSGKTYTATVKTNLGTVVMKMDPSKAPKAANAFVFLSGYHYYDNTKSLWVAQSLDIIQGGSPHTQSNADTGPGFSLTDEPTFTTDSAGQMKGPYTYNAGDLALANSGEPNSADGQFFFVTGPNGKNMNAQGTYMIIAHVTSGLRDPAEDRVDRQGRSHLSRPPATRSPTHRPRCSRSRSRRSSAPGAGPPTRRAADRWWRSRRPRGR